MSDLLNPSELPNSFVDEDALDEFMTRPSRALIDDLEAIDGDIMVLGVGGKMGPTLARLAKRAAPDKNVIGVARFSEPSLPAKLKTWDIETIKADLLDRDALAKLPKPKNIVFMAGRKFGSTGSEEFTWAMNVHCPALVAEAFHHSRIISFSTICVYPFAPVSSGGPTEDMPPNPPGEYAQSCIGRERMFQHFSKQFDTPGCIIRLSYAIDMRYGVLFDVANAVFSEEPLDVTMGHANVIWQGDANAQALRALGHCETPAWPLNVSGSAVTSIRWLAEEFGNRLGKTPVVTGEEAETAWLANTDKAQALFGQPLVPMDKMIDWVADWVSKGNVSLDKPTHFEARDGAY
ncbi:MAG: NAD(P)-dependent oxidoreductase [Rhodospirillales bacterium]|jgi:nucleoside-diphosphate-sugar epimerase